jgi:hypothetical protein
VDLSALIFVAVAVAWAIYLVPMALKHHTEVSRSRSVDRFSDKLRVLARREPVDKNTARLVTEGTVESRVEIRSELTVEAPAPAAAPELTPAQLRARRAAAKRATKRRRNVLAVLLVVNLVVVGVAAFSVIAWPYVAIPVGLLVAWLVACRLMVKSERRVLAPATRMPAETPVEEEGQVQTTEPAVEVVDEVDPMEDTSAGIAAIVDPAMWDPVPVTLPTYVTKPAATRRTVRTIDLDSTGVWTSGRTDADAQLAREADEADKAARKTRRDGDDQQAVGS